MSLQAQLSLLENMAAAGSPDDVIEIFDKALNEIGAEYHGIFLLPSRAERIEDVALAWKVPPEWRTFYSTNNLFQRDPAVRQCRRSVMPFDWASTPYNPRTEFRWGEVLARGRDFGIHKGVVVPIPSPAGMIGLVWGAGPHFDDRSSHLPHLQIVGLNVFHRLQQLGAAVKKITRLTARERDVMAWLSKGKTPWQIGHFLNVSQRIVDWHIDEACRKLGAADSQQAIMILERGRHTAKALAASV